MANDINFELKQLVRNNCRCHPSNCDNCEIDRQTILAVIEYINQIQKPIEKQINTDFTKGELYALICMKDALQKELSQNATT